MKTLKELKSENINEYYTITNSLTEEQLMKINKRIVVFSLGIYDHPDYLLSAIFATRADVESATLEDFEQPEHRSF